jgi:competence protein ComGC
MRILMTGSMTTTMNDENDENEGQGTTQKRPYAGYIADRAFGRGGTPDNCRSKNWAKRNKRQDQRVQEAYRPLFALLIVILVVGALLVILVPRMGQSATNANINACKSNIDVINMQIELYKAEAGLWPTALTDVTTDPNYFRDGEPTCPFGTPYTMGPNHRIVEHSH